MTCNDLIGQVGTLYLKSALQADDTGDTARFIIDRLSAKQTAAIARAILSEPDFATKVDIRLPMHFMEGENLPESVLTHERATYHRHAKCAKPVLLLATTGDDEAQSLNLVSPVGTAELLERPELWTSVAMKDVNLTAEHEKWWQRALAGLIDLNIWSMEQLASYVLDTREAMLADGHPLIFALGAALPALRIPRDICYFNAISEKQRTHASLWRRLFDSACRRRACYLCKLTPSQTLMGQLDLQCAFESVRERIVEKYHVTVKDFIEAPTGWNTQAVQLSQCEWEEVGQHLFEGVQREKQSIGELTFALYDEREKELLTDEERDYVNRLRKRGKSPQKEEEDEIFYERHRNELKDDRKLKSLWDKFIFGSALECDDFLVGLVRASEILFTQRQPSRDARLTIRCDRRSKRDFRDLNVDAGLFFARRYKGLPLVLGQKVECKMDTLFDFPQLVETWRNDKKTKLCTSSARAALQLKFTIELDVELLTGGSERYTTQLIWQFNPNAAPVEFAHDLARLEKHPLVLCGTSREPINAKGELQPLDLSNVLSLSPSYGRDRGSFVPVYAKANDVEHIWLANLKEAIKLELIDEETADDLKLLFVSFVSCYREAIEGFVSVGLSHAALIEQSGKYAAILDVLCRRAKGDRNRELLLVPLMQLGIVQIDGGRPAAIVTAWNPLRMAAIGVKAKQVAVLLHDMMTLNDVPFSDTGRFFFRDLEESLGHPYYPEIVLGWRGRKPELLSVTDVVGDYSLHEYPISNDGNNDDTNENPSAASNLVSDLVERYIDLQPHEQSNLSVVLYNCDSVRLPQAVVEKIRARHEEDDNVLCQIVLRHRSNLRLRSLYERIIDSSDADMDAFTPSEATRDFMARLRINIMADQAPPPDPREGCPMDIVFCQDVISRHSELAWYKENLVPFDLYTLVPPHWSRRRPTPKDSMKSAVYLVSPAQPFAGLCYITALTSFLQGDWDEDENHRLLPARQLDFQSPEMASILEETHNLANWVVNYDELLDRRQLMSRGVQVIRYKQSSTQGRNLIISSDAPLGLLHAMLVQRLKLLNLDLPDEDYWQLAKRLREDANGISGDIVLRAARRGRNASELIGVVLSRFLLESEIGKDKYIGWFFLDDYADWLGSREQQMADIIALSPSVDEKGMLRIDIIISEAKYIDAASLAPKRKESQKQVRDTMSRISDALYGDPRRIDRELWLARISDLILDGIQFPTIAGIDLSAWRRAIREGNCEICLRGYSHVFVPTGESGDISETVPVARCDGAYQEIFARDKVREIIGRYIANADPLPIRRAIADDDIWKGKKYSAPTRSPKKQQSSGVPIAATEGKLPDSSVSKDLKQSSAGKPSDMELKKEGHHPVEPSVCCFEGVSDFIASQRTPAVDTNGGSVWLSETESQCKGALQQFQLQAKLVSSYLTPNSAILKFRGTSNLTMDHVLHRRSEFLTTHGLNLVSVRAEPGIVSLSIARPNRHILRLPNVWAEWKPNVDGGNCELLIAVKEEDASLLLLSPKVNAPHTLVAGSTNSGKSVLMQNMLLSIATTNTPSQAQILLIDPKMGVDYFAFEGLPHLKDGIIDEQQKAHECLSALVSEMDRRYRILRENRVSNVFELNAAEHASERLPHLWVVHDEFAEWMLTPEYRELVTAVVARLGVKARAAGIFLIFAAQRPDSNVMPLQLRANLGNRLILRVDSEGTSEIALNEKGAERLLGKGHLAAKIEGESEIIIAQVPFVKASEIQEIVRLIRVANERVPQS